MNFAGIHRLPVIFLCENNRYAISVPQHKQMLVDSVASRAAGYGFPGVVVDGTDMFAVYEAVSAAAARARAGDGPTLVETRVERLLPHTTDDDHTKYRPPGDIEAMALRDPLEITRNMLLSRGLLTDEDDNRLRLEARGIVNRTTDEVDALEYPSASTIHDHLFAAAESPVGRA
jgi:2-oxoisovalerate dehydrogenase E1 component alpha subunit